MGPKEAVALNTSVGETRTMIPVYRVPGWKGTITGVRLHFDNRGLAALVIKSFHTACDTRHTMLPLTLTLLMLGVGANNAHHTFTLDHLAFFAQGFY